MADYAHLKPQHQFVALIDMYIHAKDPLYNSLVFEILKAKSIAI